MAEVVRTKRTVLTCTPKDGAYAAVGTTPIADAIVPIYDAFNPFQAEIETNKMNRARGTLDQEKLWVGIATAALKGNIYVYGTGDSATAYGGPSMTPVTTLADVILNLPPWAKTLLPATGFTPKVTTATMTGEVYVCFNPVSDTFWQLDFNTYLNSYQHTGTHARGNIVFSADASNPVIGAFDFMGVWKSLADDANSGKWQANPDDSGSDPGIPPRLCGIDTFLLRPQGKNAVIVPKLKSFSLDLGRAPEQRRNANAVSCLEEITFMTENAAKLQVVIEVENMEAALNGTGYTNCKNFIESCYEGQGFAFELNVGPWTNDTNEGKRFQFRNYHDTDTQAPGISGATGTELLAATDFRAQLSRAPQYTDVGGARCLDLEFQLAGDQDNFLQIVAM